MITARYIRGMSCSLGMFMAFWLAIGTLAPIPAWTDEYREIKGDLRYATPRWYQTLTSTGYPVGCGATAYAIVFGYWKEHKGKTKLLPGVTMPHTQSDRDDPALAPAISRIAQIMDTTYGTWQGKKYGRTTGSKMEKADNYVKTMGYNCTIERIRGTEYDKFRKVKAWLDLDRPVIILTNESDAAFTSLHYPVIEKARLRQKKVFGKWHDRDVYYFVNMGDGGPNKEIWVREYGGNDHHHTGSFSMYLVNIY